MIFALLAFAGLRLLHGADSTGSVPTKNTPQGVVVGVSPANGQLNDKLVVRMRELDGWLIKQMRAKALVDEKHFSADQFRVTEDSPIRLSSRQS